MALSESVFDSKQMQSPQSHAGNPLAVDIPLVAAVAFEALSIKNEGPVQSNPTMVSSTPDPPIYNLTVIPPALLQINPQPIYIFTPFLLTTDPPVHSLLDFLGGADDPNSPASVRAVRFFRSILTYLETDLNLVHYKFVILPRNPNSPLTFAQEQQSPPFYLEVTPSDSPNAPAKTLHCISCDPHSEVAHTSALPHPDQSSSLDSSLVNCWLDAKARPMYIVTPIRHVERLAQCTDAEILATYRTAYLLLRSEFALLEKSEKEPLAIRFARMTLNHGNARNVEHLHLKVRLLSKDFHAIRKSGWPRERQDNYERLKAGLYKRDKRLKKVNSERERSSKKD